MNLKLNTSEMTNYYDKQTINTSLNLKVDKSAVYSITDVNDRLNKNQKNFIKPFKIKKFIFFSKI